MACFGILKLYVYKLVQYFPPPECTPTTTMAHLEIKLCLAILIISLGFLIFRYPNRCVRTINRPELPGPPGLPLIGNMILMFQNRHRMLKFVENMETEYGPLFTFTLPGWGRNIVINRPEWLEHMRKGGSLFRTVAQSELMLLQEILLSMQREMLSEMYLANFLALLRRYQRTEVNGSMHVE